MATTIKTLAPKIGGYVQVLPSPHKLDPASGPAEVLDFDDREVLVWILGREVWFHPARLAPIAPQDDGNHGMVRNAPKRLDFVNCRGE
jgi:hypothetical protein